MKVIDPGHTYGITNLDGAKGNFSILRFVKRVGEKYPGNVAPGYSGCTSQEVLRALIDRLIYVNAQVPNWQTKLSIKLLSFVIFLLEHRAAQRNRIGFPWVSGYRLGVSGEVCFVCGHVVCRHLSVGHALQFYLETRPEHDNLEDAFHGGWNAARADDYAKLCEKEKYCAQRAGHAGECDDLPF